MNLHVGIHPSKVATTRLKLDKTHKMIFEGQARSHQVGKENWKCKEETLTRQRNKVISYKTSNENC